MCPIEVKSFGGETRIISDATEPSDGFPSASLIKGIARAREWYDRIVRGEATGFEDLAQTESRYFSQSLSSCRITPNPRKRFQGGHSLSQVGQAVTINALGVIGFRIVDNQN
jgi:hypothetical protein